MAKVIVVVDDDNCLVVNLNRFGFIFKRVFLQRKQTNKQKTQIEKKSQKENFKAIDDIRE